MATSFPMASVCRSMTSSSFSTMASSRAMCRAWMRSSLSIMFDPVSAEIILPQKRKSRHLAGISVNGAAACTDLRHESSSCSFEQLGADERGHGAKSVTYRNTFPDLVSPSIHCIEKVPPLGSIPGGGNVKLPEQPDRRYRWHLRIWPIASDTRLMRYPVPQEPSRVVHLNLPSRRNAGRLRTCASGAIGRCSVAPLLKELLWRKVMRL